MSVEPIKLADGTLIFPDGRVVPSGGAPTPREDGKVVPVPTNREAQRLVVAARKKLADLPDVPRAMNTVSVVLSYTLFGLDDVEIALATGLTELQVGRLKLGDAYKSMYANVTNNIIAAESGDVRDLFTKQARTAAQTMMEAMSAGKAADRIKAAADILDRGGFRPNDVVEHRHQLEGGLTIEIVRRDDKQLPIIDVSLEDE